MIKKKLILDISVELNDELEKFSSRLGTSKGAITKVAIAEYLRQNDRP